MRHAGRARQTFHMAPGTADARRLRIGFIHPVLGLGGAERLVVDAALELRARGHEVAILTAEWTPARAFAETRDGRVQVRVRGGWLPATIAGRLQAPCAIARQWWLAAMAMAEGYDVLVTDIAPYALPWLRLLRALPQFGRPAPRLVYYCHYPDQLLAPARRGWYRAYRWPLDAVEGPSMRAADLVLVNSAYTARAAARLGVGDAEILYPGVPVEPYGATPDLTGDESTWLVISRFDPRKNQALAVAAFARLRDLAPDVFGRTSLVLAGGLDPSRREDRETAAQLRQLIAGEGLTEKIVLRLSPGDDQRMALLRGCLALVHPTPDEHFGIVPVEAMAAGRPVVAVANGGPLETVVDGETGFLCAPTPEAFAAAMARLGRDAGLRARLGSAGRARATRFSRRAFGDALDGVLRGLVDRHGEAASGP